MLVFVVLLAVAFDYTNGFHDTANSIATSVATRALSPGLGDPDGDGVQLHRGVRRDRRRHHDRQRAWSTTQTTTQAIVAAALIGAIAWNLITWQQGLPELEQPRADRWPARGDDHRRRDGRR